MSDFSARAETEIALDDTYLEDHRNDATAVIDCMNRSPIEAFTNQHRQVPGTHGSRTGPMFQIRGMSINGSRSDEGGIDETATSAFVNRALLNNGLGKERRVRRSCGIIHPESVRYIYPISTSARGISLYC